MFIPLMVASSSSKQRKRSTSPYSRSSKRKRSVSPESTPKERKRQKVRIIVASLTTTKYDFKSVLLEHEHERVGIDRCCLQFKIIYVCVVGISLDHLCLLD